MPIKSIADAYQQRAGYTKPLSFRGRKHEAQSEQQTINMEYQAIFGFLAKIDDCICKLQVAILGSKRIFTAKLGISPSQGKTNKIISLCN